MTTHVNISDVDKASLLAKLYNNAKPSGMGVLHFEDSEMTKEEAQKLLDNSRDKYFDYIRGRCLKVGLSGDEIDPYFYDRDYGIGRVRYIVDTLKNG